MFIITIINAASSILKKCNAFSFWLTAIVSHSSQVHIFIRKIVCWRITRGGEQKQMLVNAGKERGARKGVKIHKPNHPSPRKTIATPVGRLGSSK